MTRSEELERDKQQLILQYLALQDQADAVNEKIYRVCCEIEALNAQITQARAEEEKLRPARPPVAAE
jgi:hypothetical protein